ncbi:MAG: guanylate kinase [Acidobacteriota bacterium]
MERRQEQAPGYGDVFIVSAPSGTGKTTLIRTLFDPAVLPPPPLEFAVSHTTRAPRRGENDGEAYHFVSDAEFSRMVEANAFLEWAEVHGNRYGTSLAEVDSRLRRGVDVLLDIDVQGAEQVLKRRPETIAVFILPPSRDELARRLRARKTEHEAVVERRLAAAGDELRCCREYHYVIVNDDASRASRVLASIILTHRARRSRMQSAIEQVWVDFRLDETREPEPRG